MLKWSVRPQVTAFLDHDFFALHNWMSPLQAEALLLSTHRMLMFCLEYTVIYFSLAIDHDLFKSAQSLTNVFSLHVSA